VIRIGLATYTGMIIRRKELAVWFRAGQGSAGVA